MTAHDGAGASLADARSGLLHLGRGLGYADEETIDLVERLTGTPWAACGWPELDATLAVIEDALAARCPGYTRRRGAARSGGRPRTGRPRAQ